MKTTEDKSALTTEQHQKFLRLVGRLSPENLWGDGEYPRDEVKRRAAAIHREWAALEKEVGRKVTEDEILAALS